MEYLIGYIIISIILMIVFIEMNKNELYQDMCDINKRYNTKLLKRVELGNLSKSKYERMCRDVESGFGMYVIIHFLKAPFLAPMIFILFLYNGGKLL
jgi:hypothetical protein|tara:strand:- start:3007 stop:3297 length:291 start_codon:yes stop_codon:yes gene_type:complete